MAAPEAVRAVSISREELRLSMQRMQFHIDRGVRGARGVAREVAYIDALHRQATRLGGRAVNIAVNTGASRSFGRDTLNALEGAKTANIGRVKSSVLADFSADGLEGARSRGVISGEPWVWVANSSACPSCLSEHGSVHTGPMVPLHPSCLCIPEAPSDDIQPLDRRQLVEMQDKYGDPRYAKIMDAVSKGERSVKSLRSVNAVNRTAAGKREVVSHRGQGIGRQTTLGDGPQSPATATAARVPVPNSAGDDLEDLIKAQQDQLAQGPKGGAVAQERLGGYTRAGKNNIEGSPTDGHMATLAEAERLIAESVPAEFHHIFVRAMDRVKTYKVVSSQGKRSEQKFNGLWEEGSFKRGKAVNRRLSLEMNRTDAAEHNKWVREYNKTANDIKLQNLRVSDIKLSADGKRVLEPPKYEPNPRYIPDRAKRVAYMDEWIKANPEPATKYPADPLAVAQTLIHELVHVLDFESGWSSVTRSTPLRDKLIADGMKSYADKAYAAGDANMWYAAKLHEEGETIAEFTRFYFFGSRYDNPADYVRQTAAQWRARYPEAAKWVEDNILANV